MKPLWWMLGVSVASAVAVGALPGVESDREVVLGMLGPLCGAAGTWVMVARVFPTRPEWLTPLMVSAFAIKLVFFGLYVTLMLTALAVEPMPFVISFTTYFIGLHMFEAVCLQRLFAYVGRVPPQADPPGH